MLNTVSMETLQSYLDGKPKGVFASELEISAAFLSQILSGHRKPSLEVAFRIERLTDGHVPASSWVKGATIQNNTATTDKQNNTGNSNSGVTCNV